MGGFLRKLVIPEDFTNRVVNIHPSLIPAYCGKGMYGMRVHTAVVEEGIINGSDDNSSSTPTSEIALELFSPEFENEGSIPVKYGRQNPPGSNISPPLIWTWQHDDDNDDDSYSTTIESWALIMDDPDAPSSEPWVHWIIYNLPSYQNGLIEGLNSSNIPDGAIFGINSWGAAQYDGPQPPSGIHRYQFHLYSLTTKVGPTNTTSSTTPLTKIQLLDKIQDYIYAETVLVGTFSS